MKTLSKVLLVPMLFTVGVAFASTAGIDDYPSDENNLWTDPVGSESRVNFSIDSISDTLPAGVGAGDLYHNPRHFFDDTHYWDDQMFGRDASRVNFSISPEDLDYGKAIDNSVFGDY